MQLLNYTSLDFTTLIDGLPPDTTTSPGRAPCGLSHSAVECMVLTCAILTTSYRTPPSLQQTPVGSNVTALDMTYHDRIRVFRFYFQRPSTHYDSIGGGR